MSTFRNTAAMLYLALGLGIGFASCGEDTKAIDAQKAAEEAVQEQKLNEELEILDEESKELDQKMDSLDMEIDNLLNDIE